METVRYFGFGANRDRDVMEAIIGRPISGGIPSVLKGYQLCVQTISEIPDTIFPTAPLPVSPRAIIARNWPPTFKSYIIRPSTHSEVAGIIWSLSELERDLVRDWELVDFGWSEGVTGWVVTDLRNEMSVEIERVRKGQEIFQVADGLHYETFLHPREDFVRIASISRKEFFERQNARIALAEGH